MRSISCVVLLVLAAMASANNEPQYNLDDAPALFEQFMKDYNRQYKDEADKKAHYEAFVESLKAINKANAESTSATFGINHLADYTADERKHLFGLKVPEKKTVE